MYIYCILYFQIQLVGRFQKISCAVSVGGVGTSSAVAKMHDSEHSHCAPEAGNLAMNQDYIKHTLYPYVRGPKVSMYLHSDPIHAVISLARRFVQTVLALCCFKELPLAEYSLSEFSRCNLQRISELAIIQGFWTVMYIKCLWLGIESNWATGDIAGLRRVWSRHIPDEWTSVCLPHRRYGLPVLLRVERFVIKQCILLMCTDVAYPRVFADSREIVHEVSHQR